MKFIQYLNLILLIILFFIILFILFPQQEHFMTHNFKPESGSFGDCPKDDWEGGCVGGSKYNCDDRCPPEPTKKELKGLDPQHQQQKIDEYKKYHWKGQAPNDVSHGTCCYRTAPPRDNPNKKDFQLRKGAPNIDAGCVRGKFHIGDNCPKGTIKVKADISNDWYGVCCRKPTVNEKTHLS